MVDGWWSLTIMKLADRAQCNREHAVVHRSSNKHDLIPIIPYEFRLVSCQPKNCKNSTKCGSQRRWKIHYIWNKKLCNTVNKFDFVCFFRRSKVTGASLFSKKNSDISNNAFSQSPLRTAERAVEQIRIWYWLQQDGKISPKIFRRISKLAATTHTVPTHLSSYPLKEEGKRTHTHTQHSVCSRASAPTFFYLILSTFIEFPTFGNIFPYRSFIKSFMIRRIRVHLVETEPKNHDSTFGYGFSSRFNFHGYYS